MVAARHRQLSYPQANGYNSYDHLDLENGNGHPRTPRPRQRFRDAIEATIENNRAEEFKTKLLESVDHGALEKFRKSNEEVLLKSMCTQI